MSDPSSSVAPALKVENLSKVYPQRHGILSRRAAVTAVDNVDLTIAPGTTFGVVGESGSGKTTLALCVAGVEVPSSGFVWLDGQNLAALPPLQRRRLQTKIQLVFQDSSAALNPWMDVESIIAEPINIRRACSREQTTNRAAELAHAVGLSQSLLSRHPHQLSGGQRQRVAIARALAADAKVIIFDEAFSGLDLSVQAQIVNLLQDLQQARALAYIVISHDLRLVGTIADEIAVFHRGRIVESGSPPQILQRSQHPYTKTLVAALLALEPPQRIDYP